MRGGLTGPPLIGPRARGVQTGAARGQVGTTCHKPIDPDKQRNILAAAPVGGLEILEQRAAHARTALDELLDHSSVRYDDVHARLTSMVFIGWNNWQWTQLPDAGQPAVKRAREATGRLRDPKGAPADSIDAIREKVAATRSVPPGPALTPDGPRRRRAPARRRHERPARPPTPPGLAARRRVLDDHRAAAGPLGARRAQARLPHTRGRPQGQPPARGPRPARRHLRERSARGQAALPRRRAHRRP